MSVNIKLLIAAAIAVLLLIAASMCAFVVQQHQVAIVLQLGKPVGDVRQPGLHFKLPFVQEALLFDTRIKDYTTETAEILTIDKKTLVVDNYTKWRIIDPLEFYRKVRTDQGAQARLEDIVYSQLRVALGRFTLPEIVSSDRQHIMESVTNRSSELLKEYGIEVVDVRIKRTDLPPENERAIFGRMQAERQRQAKQYRSEGEEEAAKIKSQADKERVLILAEAERQTSVLRGEGDAEATRIYAEAVQKSPEFYSFKRSLEAYMKSFQNNSKLVFTPDAPFFKYLR